ncbi:alpha-(1,3)-fucosyltransferase C [Caerostris darwini]|uniref:Fucosyltransferase n=1 Tax=Caerostris darwini TaxID=1538125 RepID=A0AAV4VMS1_9ARAC|nr:alpha-(1,3)-fucosyltransferase C [Caerostris darwini]
MRRYVLRRFHSSNDWKIIFIFLFLLLSAIILCARVIHHFASDLTFSSTVLPLMYDDIVGLQRINFSQISTFPVVREFRLDPKTAKYVNENARIIGFPIRDYKNLSLTNLSKKTIFLATPYFTLWNPDHYYFFHTGSETFERYSCPIYNCHVTKDPADISKADALLFHVRDIEVNSFPPYHNPNQVWIMYSNEPPWLEVKDMRKFNGVFNWTMSYRRNSDVPMSYGFIGQKPNPVIKTSVLEKRLDSLRTKKNKAVWFVSNCKTDSNREAYVMKLRKIYPVDIFGGCGMEACRPAETKRCYEKIAIKYKFYLAFENAICQDYATEKLFNSLNYDIVPVVLGGVNYSSIVPPHSVINAMDFSDPEKLGMHLWEVSRNDELYLSYFNWKNTYRSYLQPWMCDLCAKLHENFQPQVKRNLDSWWYEDFTCKRWANNSFEYVNEHVFPVFHSKIFQQKQV